MNDPRTPNSTLRRSSEPLRDGSMRSQSPIARQRAR
jgi:hypothetical protein